MKKHFLIFVALVIISIPVTAAAQIRSADLIGFEKAEYVTGKVSLSADGAMVMVRDLATKYNKTLVIYLARGFEADDSIKVGEIMAGTTGNMTFDAPAGNLEEMDSVVIRVPEWTVPVALGVLR